MAALETTAGQPTVFSTETVTIISNLALREGIAPAALLAVAEVESAGVPYWKVKGQRVPAIRFEGHYFHKLLPPKKRAIAVREGLASPYAGAIKNPRSYEGRYELLARARKIDEDAALQSFSWGLGQVMGANWRDLGFSSPQALVDKAHENVGGQVELMLRFIRANKLTGFLKNLKWHPFAGAYNGPAYRKNKYATKMAAAYKRWLPGYVQGAQISTIYDIQQDLELLGYEPGKLDGIDGTRTRHAVKRFQADKGLVVDGIVGVMTREALDDAVEALKQEGRDKLRKQSRAKDDSSTAVGIGTGAIAVTTLLNDNIWVILAGIALIMAGGILIYLNRKDD